MLRGKDKRKNNEGFHLQSGLSRTEAPDGESCDRAWESDDLSSSQSLDDSQTPAAGWSRTRELILGGWWHPLRILPTI